jgi:hypothetical protein
MANVKTLDQRKFIKMTKEQKEIRSIDMFNNQYICCKYILTRNIGKNFIDLWLSPSWEKDYAK